MKPAHCVVPAIVAIAFLASQHAHAAPRNNLISVANLASQSANGPSVTGLDHALSSDGRYVVFSSSAFDLIEGDSNGVSDVFVRDRKTGITTRISVTSSGGQGNGSSYGGTLSADGRYVAFVSDASNLVAGDLNNLSDVFLHDRTTGVTTAVSIDAQGMPAGGCDPSLSADSRFVAYCQLESGTFGQEILIYNRIAHTTRHVPIRQPLDTGEIFGKEPSISANGRYIAFTHSSSSNRDSPEGNGGDTVYRYDTYTGAYQNVSIGGDDEFQIHRGHQPAISADGQLVAFSAVTNFVEQNGFPYIRFGIYVRDVLKQTTNQVSVSFDGGKGMFPHDSAISANGRYVTFSDKGSLVDGNAFVATFVYVHDRYTHVTRRVNDEPVVLYAGNTSIFPSISADGHTIAYTSNVPDLVANDFNAETDVIVTEMPPRTEISINAAGAGMTDSLGRFWAADRGFNTGGVSTFGNPIANTLDDKLYQTERWDPGTAPELQYSFAVPNGSYIVRLHFAENYVRNFGVGRRVFDVDMEGSPRFTGIDVFAAAGAQTALVKSSRVAVTDGQINIQFRHRVQNPIIDALEIIQE